MTTATRLSHCLRRALSSKAFVLPHSASAVQDINPSELWATATDPNPTKPPTTGTTRIFYNTPKENLTVISALDSSKGTEPAKRELVRKCIGSAVKAVTGLGINSVKEVVVDGREDPHAAAVAAHLAAYKFTLKTDPPSPFNPNGAEGAPEPIKITSLEKNEEWERGVLYAECQNFARTLTALPANVITPTTFCERVKKEFVGIPNVEIIIRDQAWAEEKGMRTFLSVARGTSEPPKLLEIHYKGSKDPNKRPLALVGKGVTFDSGGISLKPASGMKLMVGDMGGAAAVVSAALGIAKMGLDMNLVVVTPLTENMPGPSAMKPGDIVYAMNGKSVEVDNTDAEGRLILADALYYTSSVFNPHTVIDVATLTGAMMIALGEVFNGCYSTSDKLYNALATAGLHEHDRFWQMPLDDEYMPLITGSNADLCNSGGRSGGSTTAALFLRAFVDGLEKGSVDWAHLDIAGSMEATRPGPYQEKGMTGRPVRSLIEFARRVCEEDVQAERVEGQ